MKRLIVSVFIGLLILVPCFSQVELFSGLYSGMSIEQAHPIAVSAFGTRLTSIAQVGQFFAGWYEFKFSTHQRMDVSQFSAEVAAQSRPFTRDLRFDVIHYLRDSSVVGELFFLGESLIAVRVYDSESTSSLRAIFNGAYGRTILRCIPYQNQQVDTWRVNGVLVSLLDIKSLPSGMVDFVDAGFISSMETIVAGDYPRIGDL
jgi:hypothetical protein